MATSLSAEVGGDFAPAFGFPFDNRVGIGVVLQPGFCTADDGQQFAVALGGHKFGIALFVAHPFLGYLAVAVNRHIAAFLFQQSQSMNNGKKLADIVRSVVIRTDTENFLSRANIYAPIFHNAGIAATTGIDGNAFHLYFGNHAVVDRLFLFLQMIGNGTQHLRSLPVALAIGKDSLRAVGESLVAGIRKAIGFRLTFFPRFVDSRVTSHPNHIVFAVCHNLFLCNKRNSIRRSRTAVSTYKVNSFFAFFRILTEVNHHFPPN